MSDTLYSSELFTRLRAATLDDWTPISIMNLSAGLAMARCRNRHSCIISGRTTSICITMPAPLRWVS